MNRRGENLAGWTAFDNFAFVENGDALADSGDRWQVVRNIEDRHSGFAIQPREE